MEINYNQEADILNLRLSGEKIIESDEKGEGTIFDYDKKGNVVSIEILDASEKIDNPLNISYKAKKIVKINKKGIDRVRLLAKIIGKEAKETK